MQYRTYFKLSDPVLNVDDANDYLHSDDMTAYLISDRRIPEEIRNKVLQIKWTLITDSFGYIELSSEVPFLEHELVFISDFVKNQHSDGLGPGFEEQDFSYYQNPESENANEDGYVCSMFESNNFTFYPIS